MGDLPLSDPITGADGELLTRLEQALRARSSGKSILADASVVLAVKLGISRAEYKNPDNFPEELVSKAKRLIALGLLESFIVISIRNEVSRWFKSFSSFDGADERRTGIRNDLQSILDDEVRFQAFRQALIEKDPSGGGKTEDEVRESLRKMIQFAHPVGATEVAEAWSLEQHWSASCASYLSDEAISAWEIEHIRVRSQ